MADQAITALTALTTPAVEDLIAVVDDVAGTPITKKVTLADLKALIAPVSVYKLASNEVSDESPVTTMGKVVGIEPTLAAGTYVFDYHLVWQTSATATAVKFGVNFSGTQTRFVAEATGFEITTAASTGVTGTPGAAFGLRAGGQSRAPSTTVSIYGPTATDATGADVYTVIRGLIVVTVSGALQLYFGSEAASSTQTLMAGSSLIVTKIA